MQDSCRIWNHFANVNEIHHSRPIIHLLSKAETLCLVYSKNAKTYSPAHRQVMLCDGNFWLSTWVDLESIKGRLVPHLWGTFLIGLFEVSRPTLNVGGTCRKWIFACFAFLDAWGQVHLPRCCLCTAAFFWQHQNKLLQLPAWRLANLQEIFRPLASDWNG